MTTEKATPDTGNSRAVTRRRRQAGVEVPRDPITLGNILAASGFFDDSREGARAAVKVMAGQELGLGPIASMTGIYIVKGRVTLSANLIAGAIRRRRPEYDYRILEHDESKCSIEFLIDGESVGVSTFTSTDAAKAGLDGGENWKHHPRNMLFARAMSNGAKWYMPDVFGGPVYTPEELGAEIDGGTGEVLSLPEDASETDAPADAEVVASDEDIERLQVAASGLTFKQVKMVLASVGLPAPRVAADAFKAVPADRASGLADALLAVERKGGAS